MAGYGGAPSTLDNCRMGVCVDGGTSNRGSTCDLARGQWCLDDLARGVRGDDEPHLDRLAASDVLDRWIGFHLHQENCYSSRRATDNDVKRNADGSENFGFAFYRGECGMAG